MQTILISALLFFLSARAATNTVYVGGALDSDPAWAYLQFFPSQISVSQGDTIDFVIVGYDMHSITFVPDNDPNPGLFRLGSNGSVLLSELALPFPPNATSPVVLSSALTTNVSSGVLAPGSNWTVLVTAPAGTVLNYWCIVHPFMKGSVLVSSNMTSNATANLMSQYALINDAAPSLYITKALNNTVPSSRNSTNSTGRIWTVRMVGDYFFMFSYLRFIPSNFTIAVGDTVEFVNDDINSHIVAFGSSLDSIPSFIVNGSLNEVLFKGTTGLSSYMGGFETSGILQPVSSSAPYQGLESAQPFSFTLTFMAPGTYYYEDPIHAANGMVGYINVTSALLCQ